MGKYKRPKTALGAKNRSIKTREKYYNNPKLCKECNAVIPYEKRFWSIFCSQSCAAIFNNRQRELKVQKYACLNCGELRDRHANQFCSNKCQQEYKYKEFIENWINGNISGTTNGGLINSAIFRYLFEINNSSCQNCGWNRPNLITRKVPLEIHHIDGNHLNNQIENLQLLCPNCHALTDNFRNLGKRKSTRIRRNKSMVDE